jgi:hypothetical protein
LTPEAGAASDKVENVFVPYIVKEPEVVLVTETALYVLFPPLKSVLLPDKRIVDVPAFRTADVFIA